MPALLVHRRSRQSPAAPRERPSAPGDLRPKIALIALDAGTEEIWTHDSRFVRLKGLRVLEPIPKTIR